MHIFFEVLFAKANGTITGYLCKCREFLAWLKVQNIPLLFPIKVHAIAAFIVHKSKFANSDSTIVSIAAAIKWLHSNTQSLGLTSNATTSYISERRKLHKPPVQKEPLPFSLVKAIIDRFGQSDCSLINLRTACYVSLKFTLLF